MYQTTYFVVYSLVCGLLLMGLAGTLHWTANLFLQGRAGRNGKLMLALARLLAMGCYLVCGGYFAMTCPTDWQYRSLGEVAHVISLKAGFFLLLVGAMVVFNLLILVLLRRHVQEAS